MEYYNRDSHHPFRLEANEVACALHGISVALDHELDTYLRFLEDHKGEKEITLPTNYLGGLLDMMRTYKSWIPHAQQYNFDKMDKEAKAKETTIRFGVFKELLSECALMELVGEDEGGNEKIVFSGEASDFDSKDYDDWVVTLVIPVTAGDEDFKDKVWGERPGVSVYIEPFRVKEIDDEE